MQIQSAADGNSGNYEIKIILKKGEIWKEKSQSPFKQIYLLHLSRPITRSTPPLPFPRQT